MDFFASQELARRNTRKLVILLIITLVCLIGSIYCLVIAVGMGAGGDREHGLFGDSLLNLPVLGIVTLVVSSIVGIGSLMKVVELRAGGSKVAQMLGGRRLLPGSTDLAERRVLNIVEEMALASGIPVPPVYVLENEPGINAFAAGHTIDDAVIGVNRGTIDVLTRDELQGVIAHEYSHILNGDMRMSLRMIGLLHGIQALALIGWLILRSGAGSGHRRSSNNKNGGGQLAILAIGAGLLAIGSIGLFFARLIKASISRQREYLADASSVQFTRNPEAISGALKTIGASSVHSRVESSQAEAISHMFFANMNGSMMAGLLSTHPPLVNRIQRIEPRFDGNFDDWFRERIKRQAERKAAEEKEVERKRTARETARPGMGKMPGMMMGGMMGEGAVGSAAMSERFPIDPAILMAAIGAPTDDDVVFSRMLVGNLPEKLLNAVRDVYGARCVVFASLLDPGQQFRELQCQHIASQHGQATLDDTLAIEQLVRSAEPRWRMPMFEIVQGALVGMSPQQYVRFRESVIWLIESDGSITLFEFFLQHHLITHLDRHIGRAKTGGIKYERIDQVADSVAVLLDMLVRHGERDVSDRQQSLDAARGCLPESIRATIKQRNEASSVKQLNEAVGQLAASSPAVRKLFLSAAATAIAFDRDVTVIEAELFRALAESLDCPVPPLIASAASEEAVGDEV